ncbi:ATP-binding protein [Nocardioides solisilvae]|uniref:ATP-binding protein n=1 Tax=Nocardioides solisilvae TaxID=1542435 RepID=UPI000D750B3A|nr:ATP-binding protein [Nocardioides solisilvae]
MARRDRVGFGFLLLFFVLVGGFVLWSQPGSTTVAEAFPVGLMAGSLLVVPRPLRPAVLALLTVVAAGLYLAAGREPVVAVGWALAAGLGAAVMSEGTTARGTRRPALLNQDDLRYFVGACAAASLLAAGICAGVGAWAGLAEWWVILLAVALPHLASYLVMVPHFMGRPRFRGVAALPERVTQWVLTVVATVVVFSPLDLPVSLAFVLIPCLGWAALRAPMRESLVQLLVVATIAHSMTVQGMGPMAADASATPVQAEMLGVVLALLVCACALTTIPYAIAVGAQRRESWQARRAQARVEQLVQGASGIAIIGTDGLGCIDLFNPGAQSLLGYSSAEVLGHSPALFHAPGEITRLAGVLGVEDDFVAVAHRLSGADEGSMDVEFLHRDGDVLTLQLAISRVHDEKGRIIGYVSTGEDVTQRVREQRVLEEALEVERKALEHLREIDAVKDSFVSGVSHELRTPITSILGYLEMLEEGGFGPLRQGQVQALGRVKGNSRRLLSLIDDLLMLSRIQDGSLAVATCQLDLRDVVAQAHEEMAPAMLAAQIDCSLVLPDDEVLVTGDEERLGRVLVNLLGNAIKFTDPLGRVDVSLQVDAQAAVLAVRDTGIGVPVEEQAQLFERFFRSTVAHERATQGSGLGLSIARAIVETHGGVIEVESGHGVGSTFRVLLPLEGAAPVPVQVQQGALAARTSAADDEEESSAAADEPGILAS